jgi:plastocyanin
MDEEGKDQAPSASTLVNPTLGGNMSRQLSPRRLCLLSLAVAGLAFGACGGDDDSSSDSGSGSSGGSSAGSQSGGGSGGGSKIALTAKEEGGFSFDKKTASAKAGKVTLTLENPSSDQAPHAIAVEGSGVDEDGEIVQPGGKSTVAADLKAGEYTFYCPVGSHRQQGMEGTLTVK